MALLELTLLELQHSGALPATEMRRIEAAHQGLDGKVLALRAGLAAVPQETRSQCLGQLPPPLAALAAASVHMSEQSVLSAAAAVAPLANASQALTPADVLPLISGLQSTLQSLPPAARRAAAAELPPTQGAMLVAVAKMDAPDVAAVLSLVPQPTASTAAAAAATNAAAPRTAAAAAAPPSGLRLGDTVVSDEAVGAVHRLLVSLPAEARDELAEALPAPARPLVSLAADLEPDEFAQASATALEAMSDTSPEEQRQPTPLPQQPRPPRPAPSQPPPPLPPPPPPQSGKGKLSGAAVVVARGQARAYVRWARAAAASADPRALGSGAALVGLAGALLGALLSLLTLRPASLLLCVGAVPWCALCVALDAELASMHAAAAAALRRAPALRAAAGRARLLAAAGLLTFCGAVGPAGPALAALSSVPLLLAAIVNAAAAHSAAPRLAALRAALPDRSAAAACFDAADLEADADGRLPRSQIHLLTSHAFAALSSAAASTAGSSGASAAPSEAAATTDQLSVLARHGGAVALTPLGGHLVTARGFLQWWRDTQKPGFEGYTLEQLPAWAHTEGWSETPGFAAHYEQRPAGWELPASSGDEEAGTTALLDRSTASSSAAGAAGAAGAATAATAAAAGEEEEEETGDQSSALGSWARQRWPVQREAVALAAGEAMVVLAAAVASGAGVVRGAWGCAAVAAAAALLALHLLAIELAQVAPPLGAACREKALPLLAAYPPLSLSLSRAGLLLLAAAVVAAPATPPPLAVLVLAPAAGAAAYAAPRVFRSARTLRRLLGALTRAAALDTFAPPDGDTPAAASLRQQLLRLLSPGDAVAPAGAAAQEVESALCDVLVSLDLDRDGRVGAADVNSWWREEKP